MLLRDGSLPLHETSATQFLILGIGLEDAQYVYVVRLTFFFPSNDN